MALTQLTGLLALHAPDYNMQKARFLAESFLLLAPATVQIVQDTQRLKHSTFFKKSQYSFNKLLAGGVFSRPTDDRKKKPCLQSCKGAARFNESRLFFFCKL